MRSICSVRGAYLSWHHSLLALQRSGDQELAIGLAGDLLPFSRPVLY